MIAITLSRPYLIETDFRFYSPFVCAAKVSFPAYVQPTRYDSSYDMTTPTLNTATTNLETIYIDNIRYTEKTSVALCQANEESFYMDIVNQDIYVHFNHNKRPTSSSFNPQQTMGYCSSTVFYDDNDFEYLPFVKSATSITDKSDRLSAGKMSFLKQTIKLVNKDGYFNSFYYDAIPGANIKIKYISEKDVENGKNILTDIYAGYSSGDNLTIDDYSVTAFDMRNKYSKAVPETYYPLEDNKIIPEGYGDCRGIPATCLNPDSASNGEYQYATDGTSLTTVYQNIDNNWVTVTPATTDPTNGKFTLTKTWTTGQPPTVKVDARLRDIDNPAEIIQDLLSREYGVLFDSINYEIANWNSEKAYFDPVYLYMDTKKSLYSYFEELQDSSSYNFKLIISPTGKFNLKVYDINRAVSKVYDSIDNIDMVRTAERDFTEYATSVTVKYNKDYSTDRSKIIKVNPYETATKDEYNVLKNIEIKSNLVSETHATDKANRVALEYSKLRPTLSIKLNELSVLQIYDIITINNYVYEGNDLINDYIGVRNILITKITYNFANEETTINGIDITDI